jgi:hypothetical protein
VRGYSSKFHPHNPSFQRVALQKGCRELGVSTHRKAELSHDGPVSFHFRLMRFVTHAGLYRFFIESNRTAKIFLFGNLPISNGAMALACRASVSPITSTKAKDGQTE